jgi:hypothetical protein
MEKDGCWGDHLTLLAISEIYGAVISIMSSVEGDNFITEIHPTKKTVKKQQQIFHCRLVGIFGLLNSAFGGSEKDF